MVQRWYRSGSRVGAVVHGLILGGTEVERLDRVIGEGGTRMVEISTGWYRGGAMV